MDSEKITQAREKAEKAKQNIKRLFADNPELKKAFKETLDEMRKPEHIKKMADDICAVMGAVKPITDRTKEL